MPIARELRWLYPIDWPEISRWVRFERAGGRCEQCGRPHKARVRQLADGRWLDRAPMANLGANLGADLGADLGAGRPVWRDDRGGAAPWPDIVDYTAAREAWVILAAAHLDHDPTNSAADNLRCLCQRCHLAHDRAHHRAHYRRTIRRRRAWRDLFEDG